MSVFAAALGLALTRDAIYAVRIVLRYPIGLLARIKHHKRTLLRVWAAA
jgi:hypothetical protein